MAEQERDLKLLRRENQALKRLVEDKELAILVKDFILKNNNL
jgi:putative transposase